MSVRRRSGLRDFLRRLLLLGESPPRTALAFAIGVTISFSPFWGLHTALALVAALLFRLNRLAVLVGAWVNNPWTVAPAASLGTALGFWVLGTEVRFPSLAEFSLLSSESWSQVFSDFEHILWPFVVGNLLLSVPAGVAAYFVLRWILARNTARESPVLTLEESGE
jgi:uncharacterized protein (DUF2062 family)